MSTAPQFHAPNLDAQRAAILASQSGSNFKFEKNSLTYLYLLPPWSAEGMYARMTKECFLGDLGHWTCLHTYEKYQAGIGRQDEVVNAVFEIYKATGKTDKVKRMLPQTRWYANCLVDGVLKYNPDGSAQPYEAVATAQQVTIPFSHGLWENIMKAISDPRVGFAADPNAAVCIVVKRTDPESGPTKYEVELAGNIDERAGTYDLDRKNLYERWPGEDLPAILTSLNDLDARWPMPEESIYVECAKLAAQLKAKLLGASAGGAGAPGFQAPGVGVQFGGSTPNQAGAAPGFQPPQPGTVPGAPGMAGPAVPGSPTAQPGQAAQPAGPQPGASQPQVPGMPGAAPPAHPGQQAVLPGAPQPGAVPAVAAPGQPAQQAAAYSMPGQLPGTVPATPGAAAPGNVPGQVPGTV